MVGEVGQDRQNSAVHSVVGQLVGLTGTQPRVSPESTGVRIEFDVTPKATQNWPRVLALLEQGTVFGLTDTEHGQVAWLRMPAEDTIR